MYANIIWLALNTRTAEEDMKEFGIKPNILLFLNILNILMTGDQMSRPIIQNVSRYSLKKTIVNIMVVLNEHQSL